MDMTAEQLEACEAIQTLIICAVCQGAGCDKCKDTGSAPFHYVQTGLLCSSPRAQGHAVSYPDLIWACACGASGVVEGFDSHLIAFLPLEHGTTDFFTPTGWQWVCQYLHEYRPEIWRTFVLMITDGVGNSFLAIDEIIYPEKAAPLLAQYATFTNELRKIKGVK